jgi:DNA-binding LacI/PurR family transcriptional regulator
MLAGLGHKRIALFTHEPSERPWGWARMRVAGVETVFPTDETVDGRRMVLYRVPDRTGELPEQISTAEKCINRAYGSSLRAGRVPREMVKAEFAAAYDHMRNQRDSVRMEPVFEAALRDPQVTAWVALNDDIACLASSFLARRKIAVPGRISVCGFDNSAISRRLGITTYDFGYDRLGHTAIQYLLRPSAFRGPDKRWVNIAGQVIVRESTGVPRRESQG